LVASKQAGHTEIKSRKEQFIYDRHHQAKAFPAEVLFCIRQNTIGQAATKLHDGRILVEGTTLLGCYAANASSIFFAFSSTTKSTRIVCISTLF
jgi:hypothetical protein